MKNELLFILVSEKNPPVWRIDNISSMIESFKSFSIQFSAVFCSFARLLLLSEEVKIAHKTCVGFLCLMSIIFLVSIVMTSLFWVNRDY